MVPMAKHVAELFERELPDRFAKQMEIVHRTPSEYVIDGTPFTTLTVNRNIAGRIHKDAGDYKEGFGVISVLRRGSYSGGTLVFPEYRCGVDLGHGDVALFNAHDWHGVIDFRDTSEDFERISVVYYYRAKMVECLPAREELARAKARGAFV